MLLQSFGTPLSCVKRSCKEIPLRHRLQTIIPTLKNALYAPGLPQKKRSGRDFLATLPCSQQPPEGLFHTIITWSATKCTLLGCFCVNSQDFEGLLRHNARPEHTCK
jgi:hypothetical protein